MAIAPKLYARMTDMAEDLVQQWTADDDRRLVEFQDKIGWPFRASQEQLNDWNAKRWPLCDCENPVPLSGAGLVSMECPVHNSRPSARED